MSFHARCEACDRAYRVPHDRKVWRCKSCDEPLDLGLAVADDAPPARAPRERATPAGGDEGAARAGSSACPACGVDHAPDARFCEACGVELASGEHRAERAPGEKRAAAVEMRKAVRRVGFLKAMLVVYLLQLVLVVGILLLAALAGEVLLLPLVISGVLLVLSILSLVFVNRRPFPIALAMALIDTLSVVLTLAFGEVTVGAMFWGLLRVALLWGATYQAARLTALAREFPDLYQSKRLRGEHLGARGRTGGESLAGKHKGRGSRSRDRTGLWMALGGVALAVVVGFFVLRPPGLPDATPSVEGFRDAWNAADVEAMASFTRADRQSKRRRIFRSAQESYDWGEAFPFVDELEVVSESRGEVRVVMHTEGGEVPMQFEWQNERWELTSLSFKGVRDWRP